MNIQQNYKEGGFTLLEAVIALAILSIGILSLMVLITSGIRGNAVANRTTEQTNIAVDLVERISSLPYDDNILSDEEGAIRLGGRYVSYSSTRRKKIEELLYAPFPHLEGEGQYDGTKADHSLEDKEIPKAYKGRFHISWNVQDNYPFPKAKTIVVTVANNYEYTEYINKQRDAKDVNRSIFRTVKYNVSP